MKKEKSIAWKIHLIVGAILFVLIFIAPEPINTVCIIDFFVAVVMAISTRLAITDDDSLSDIKEKNDKKAIIYANIIEILLTQILYTLPACIAFISSGHPDIDSWFYPFYDVTFDIISVISFITAFLSIPAFILFLIIISNYDDKPAHAPYEARKTNKRAEMLLIRVNVLRGSTLEEACQKAHDKMKEYGFEPCIPYQMLYIKHDDMPYRQYSRYSAEEEKPLGDKERGEVRENSSQNLDSKYVAITKEWVEREEKAMYPQAYHNFVEKYRQQRNNVPYFDYKKEITEDEWKLYNIVYNTFRENQGWWEYNTLEAYENEDYIVYSEIPKNEGEYNSMMSRSTRAGSYIKPKTLVWDEKYGMCEILGYHGIFYAVKTDDGRIVEDGIVTGNEKQMKRIK